HAPPALAGALLARRRHEAVVPEDVADPGALPHRAGVAADAAPHHDVLVQAVRLIERGDHVVDALPRVLLAHLLAAQGAVHLAVAAVGVLLDGLALLGAQAPVEAGGGL